jgi:hypothetical protein
MPADTKNVVSGMTNCGGLEDKLGGLWVSCLADRFKPFSLNSPYFLSCRILQQIPAFLNLSIALCWMRQTDAFQSKTNMKFSFSNRFWLNSLKDKPRSFL